MALAAEATAAFLYSAEPSVTAVTSKYTQPIGLNLAPRRPSPVSTALAFSSPSTAVLKENYPNPATAWTTVDNSISSLLKLRALSEDWDGYGAAAPNPSSIELARRFLRSLATRSEVPEPTLHANGNAILFFDVGDRYAEIEFFKDGRAEFFATRGDMEWSSEFFIDGADLPVGLREIGITT